MKANEFFKKVGIDAVRSYLAAYEDDLTDDLKRLVESHELVESYGGLGGAKEYIYCHDEYEAIYDEDGNVCDYISNSDLIEAIADVESCQ